jgi:YggT family protein
VSFLFDVCGLNSLSGILASAIQLLSLAILARALLSWVRPDPYNPIVRALNSITDPIIEPLRQVVPRFGMMDITPLVAIIGLGILGQVVCSTGF